MTDPSLIIRNPDAEPPVEDVYRHYKGGFVRVLHTSRTKDTDPPASTVTYVSMTTGELLSRPLHSTTVDAWSDIISGPDDSGETPHVVRYARVGIQPIPEPTPPPLVHEDVVRIALQLSTANMDLNPEGGLGWYTSLWRMRDVLLPTLGSPEALRLVAVLANADPDASGAGYTQSDYQAIFATVAADLATEAGIVVTNEGATPPTLE